MLDVGAEPLMRLMNAKRQLMNAKRHLTSLRCMTITLTFVTNHWFIIKRIYLCVLSLTRNIYTVQHTFLSESDEIVMCFIP